MYKDPTKIYLETRSTSAISEASPHRLITIMFDACQEQLSIAKGAMTRGDVKGKVVSIKKAIDIVVRLQASLDFERGGSIAVNLDDLYTFCTNQLALANATNDVAKLDEVFRVIAEIKLGWTQIESL